MACAQDGSQCGPTVIVDGLLLFTSTNYFSSCALCPSFASIASDTYALRALLLICLDSFVAIVVEQGLAFRAGTLAGALNLEWENRCLA